MARMTFIPFWSSKSIGGGERRLLMCLDKRYQNKLSNIEVGAAWDTRWLFILIIFFWCCLGWRATARTIHVWSWGSKGNSPWPCTSCKIRVLAINKFWLTTRSDKTHGLLYCIWFIEHLEQCNPFNNHPWMTWPAIQAFIFFLLQHKSLEMLCYASGNAQETPK